MTTLCWQTSRSLTSYFSLPSVSPCLLDHSQPLSAVSTQTDEKKKVEQFEGEEAMLTRYALHMALLEKDRELGGADPNGLQRLELYQENEWVCV